MAKIKILLADEDEKYLMPLEYKFVRELDDTATIDVITDNEYLEFFFEKPQVFDIVLINEKWYKEKYKKNDIGDLFILSESNNLHKDRKIIYKYTSVNEIYDFVISALKIKVKDGISNFETKVIVCYSPIGGIGTTTISAGLASFLSKLRKKVLFIGADNLQSFEWLMKKQDYMEIGFEKQLIHNEECDIKDIKRNIVSEEIDILKPFYNSLISLNLTGKEIIKIIKCVKEVNEYDYIFVDTESSFDESTSLLMSYATNVLIFVGQDRKSVNKLECLVRNINCSEEGKFFFICNKYIKEKENVLVMKKNAITGMVREYIEYEKNMDSMSMDEISLLKSIQKLSVLF